MRLARLARVARLEWVGECGKSGRARLVRFNERTCVSPPDHVNRDQVASRENSRKRGSRWVFLCSEKAW